MRSDFNDMTLELVLLATAGVSAMIGVAIPQPDMAAVSGAMFASFLAYMEAVEKGTPFKSRIRVTVGTAGFGSILPGAMFWLGVLRGWWTQEHYNEIPWHVWALAGCILGGTGYIVARFINSRAEKAVPKFANTVLPNWMKDSDDGSKKRK